MEENTPSSQPAATLPPQVPPPPETVPHQSSKKSIYVFLICIVILLIGAGGLYILSMKKPQAEKQAVTAVTPSAVVTQSQALERYTNETYHFSFMYPKGWMTNDKICNVEVFCVSIRGVDTIPDEYKGSFSGGRLTKDIYLKDKANVDRGEFPESGSTLNSRITSVNSRNVVQSVSWGYLSNMSDMYRMDNLGQDPSDLPRSLKEHFILSTEILTSDVELIISIVLPIETASPSANTSSAAQEANMKKAEMITRDLEMGKFENPQIEDLVKKYNALISSVTVTSQ